MIKQLTEKETNRNAMDQEMENFEDTRFSQVNGYQIKNET